MQDMNVGVIGIGFIGPAHIEALRRQGNIRVAALAHRDEEKAKAKAEMLGIEKHYGDYWGLLEKENVDVVHICTPNHLHYDMARDSLRGGKHVACETPRAMDVRQAEELVELAIGQASTFKKSRMLLARSRSCGGTQVVQRNHQRQ